MKKVTLLVATILLTMAAYAQQNADAILGIWKTGSGLGKVQIYKTTSGHYAGKLVWLAEPIDPETGKPKLDKRNPDAKLRTQPTLGVVNLKAFKYNESDKVWSGGTIYDPKNGKTYSCKITMKDNNTLDVRGYVGISLFGRTDTWTRQKE